MKLKLTRRRFGQLAIASTTVAAISYLANKTFAQQTPNLVILGVRPGRPINTNAANTLLDKPEEEGTEATSNANSIDREIVVLSLDVVTGEVKPLQTPQALPNGTPILNSRDELTGFTSLLNGQLVVAINPASTGKDVGIPTRLTFLGTSPRTVTVSGLKKQEKLKDLLVLNDGSPTGALIGLVVKKNDSPPVKLVDINIQTGEISLRDRVNLPGKEWFSNLAQCPDGKLYSIVVGRNGETSLVQLDLGSKKPNTVAKMSLDDRVWIGGFNSLVCSGAGELFAFGNRWHESTKYLHIVDTKTGKMTRLQPPFNVAKITILPA